MTEPFPTQSQVVIVGGGIIGCSIAYHLAKLGWKDVVLLERGELTCGTTWHAAGLVTQLRATHTMTELCRYGPLLFASLKDETGQDTGFKQNGSLQVARTPERLTEIARMISLGKIFGVEARMVEPAEAKSLYLLLDENKVLGGGFIPGDGQTNPIDTTMALAKGARLGGVRIIERVSVTGFKITDGAVTAVETDLGSITCETVANCAGIWARDVGDMAGVNVPLYAAEHMYVTTEADPAIPPDLPVLRDTDGYVYVKEDAGKLLVGAFEPNAKPLPLNALPEKFEFGELQENWNQFELPMARAMEMIPMLQKVGIRHFMNGPESFTPDNRFIVGEAPELKNFFVGAGFNSQGILSSAGVGRALAEWIVEGQATMDLSEIDIARFQRFQGNRRYLHDRTRESLGLLYAMHWPHRQVETARPVRETPLHSRLVQHNACFGEAAGWERANWYAPKGAKTEYQYSYGKQNWFDFVGDEHKAVREDVGMFDLSSFGKAVIQGHKAESQLQRICAADVAVPVGKVVYTQVLNQRGGIEADLTVTRLAADKYLVVTSAVSQARDFSWIRRQIHDDTLVTMEDVTSAYGVLSVMGPNSRPLLSRLSDADFSNDSFPFGTCQEIEIGYAKAYALRITYVGELGWELYLPTEFTGPVFDLLITEGAELGLRLAGYHALDSLRSEKGYRHWGHDISPADTPLEAGLGFAVSFKKNSDFIGREALETQKQAGLNRRLVHFLMDHPDSTLLHDEPIFRNGELAGMTTSGSFGYTLGRSVGMGYIRMPEDADKAWFEDASYKIELGGSQFTAKASIRPFFDPAHKRVKS
ncbi:MAG: FAD-dependent oxidoreductase [Alphaproteobacteria bacterium]